MIAICIVKRLETAIVDPSRGQRFSTHGQGLPSACLKRFGHAQNAQQSLPRRRDSRTGSASALPQGEAVVQHEAPASQYQDAVGKKQCLVHVMGHEDDGRAVPLTELQEEALHLDARKGVQRPKWLVEKQKRGVANEGSSESNPLCLTAGEGGRPRLAMPREGNLLKRAVDPLVGEPAGQPERDIVPDTLPGQQTGVLKYDGAKFGYIDLTGGVGIEARENAEECAFSAAASAEEGDELARP